MSALKIYEKALQAILAYQRNYQPAQEVPALVAKGEIVELMAQEALEEGAKIENQPEVKAA